MTKTPPEVKRLSPEAVDSLLSRLQTGSQTSEDIALIRQVFVVLAYITDLVVRKETQLKTLLRRLFGFQSEASQQVKKS